MSTPVLNKTVSVTGTSARAQKLAVTKLRVKIHEITIEMEEVVKQENYLKAHELKQKISSLEAEIKNIQASEAFVSFSPAATGIMKGVFQIFSSGQRLFFEKTSLCINIVDLFHFDLDPDPRIICVK